MKYTVDRTEGDFAVCENENGGFENIPLSDFDFTPRDGDRVEKQGEKFVLLKKETEQKLLSAKERFERLRKKQPDRN